MDVAGPLPTTFIADVSGGRSFLRMSTAAEAMFGGGRHPAPRRRNRVDRRVPKVLAIKTLQFSTTLAPTIQFLLLWNCKLS